MINPSNQSLKNKILILSLLHKNVEYYLEWKTIVILIRVFSTMNKLNYSNLFDKYFIYFQIITDWFDNLSLRALLSCCRRSLKYIKIKFNFLFDVSLLNADWCCHVTLFYPCMIVSFIIRVLQFELLNLNLAVKQMQLVLHMHTIRTRKSWNGIWLC